MFELSRDFRFESAHTLDRDVDGGQKEASRRIHGHSFRAAVTLRGERDAKTNMLVDFDVLQRALNELHLQLDHRFLNDVPGLEVPTMENIAHWIWQKLAKKFHNLYRVTVFRDSNGETCSYYGAE